MGTVEGGDPFREKTVRMEKGRRKVLLVKDGGEWVSDKQCGGSHPKPETMISGDELENGNGGRRV